MIWGWASGKAGETAGVAERPSSKPCKHAVLEREFKVSLRAEEQGSRWE